MGCKIMRVFLGLGLALASACTTEKSCTTIGCNDELALTLRLADGSAPKFDITLVVDGRTIACQAPSLGTPMRCDEGVSVALSQTGDGGLQEILTLQGAPASVAVSIAQGSATRSLGTLSPSYEVLQPNGPGCDPVCRHSTLVQLIDSWP